jgi:hypothetical protein
MNVRRTAAFFFAALAAVTSAQGPEAKVTAFVPASRAPVALEALSRQTGLKLEAAPTVARDVLLVDVRDVAASDLLQRIADATGAVWERGSEGVLRLNRGSAQMQALERQEVAAREVRIRADVERLRETVLARGPFTEKDAAEIARSRASIVERISRSDGTVSVQMPAGGPTPAGRAVARLLEVVGAAELARIPPGARTVYSTAPVGVQRAFPRPPSGVADEFLREQRLLADATRPLEDATGIRISFSDFGGTGMGPGNPALGIGKVLLSVYRAPGSSVLRAQVNMLDRNGLSIVAGQHIVAPATVAPSASEEEPVAVLSSLAREIASATAPTAASAGARQIVFSTPGQTVATSSGATVSRPRISSELREALLNPERVEPLGIFVGDIARASSRNRGKNLVALLPDAAFGTMLSAIREPEPKPTAALARDPNLLVREENGWLLVSPVEPISALRERADRARLGELLRKTDRQGFASLDDAAAFASAHERPPAAVAQRYLGLIDAELFATIAGGFEGQYEVLRFYGTLTPGQRQSLAAGNPLPIAQLTAPQRGILEQLAFHTPAGPIFGETPGDARIPAQFRRPETGVERTERMAGVAPGAVLLSVQRASAVRAVDANGGASVLSPAELGFNLMRHQRPEQAQAFGTPSRFERFAPAERTSLSFTFHFPSEGRMYGALQDVRWDARVPLGPLDALPADLRSEIDRALESFMNMEVPRVLPGRGAPPP